MYQRRLKVFMLIVALSGGAVIARLAQLQLVHGEDYRLESQAMLTYAELLPTGRGQILDRKGRVLALDVACYDFCLDYRLLTWFDELGDPTTAPATAPSPAQRRWVRSQARQIARQELGAGRGKSKEENDRLLRQGQDMLRQRIRHTWELAEQLTGVSQNEMARQADTIIHRVEAIRAAVGGPILLENQAHAVVPAMDEATAVAVRARLDEMIGASVRPSTRRWYPYGRAACHVLGMMGPVRAGEPMLVWPRPGVSMREMSEGYLPGDLAGLGGVERMCEFLLRGQRGYCYVHRGGETIEDVPATPGQDVHLTLDIELQQALEAALPRPGAIVVLDVPTGEVLALVSQPGYDLNEFRRQFNRLRDDHADLPQLHRAVAGRYPPGSSIKPIVALAAMAYGLATPQTSFTCRGYLHQPNAFRCDVPSGHGTLDLTQAIEQSCNVYFYNLGERLGVRRLVDWMGQFGYDQLPGLGLPDETAGRVPDEDGSDVPRGEEVGTARNMGIGQGPLAVTPLHQANAMAAIARGGDFVTPLLVGELSEDRRFHEVPAPAGAYAAVRHALDLVVNSPRGTGYKWVRDNDIRIAGKTGTAQTPPRRIDTNGDGRTDGNDELVRAGDTAWFTGFAPMDKPRIAFAVMVEYSDIHGGPACGPLVRQLVQLCRKLGYVS